MSDASKSAIAERKTLVVFKCTATLTVEEMAERRKQAETILGDDYRVLVVCGGMTVDVYRHAG